MYKSKYTAEHKAQCTLDNAVPCGYEWITFQQKPENITSTQCTLNYKCLSHKCFLQGQLFKCANGEQIAKPFQSCNAFGTIFSIIPLKERSVGRVL